MNAREFIFWLKGFFDFSKEQKNLSDEEIVELREEIKRLHGDTSYNNFTLWLEGMIDSYTCRNKDDFNIKIKNKVKEHLESPLQPYRTDMFTSPKTPNLIWDHSTGTGLLKDMKILDAQLGTTSNKFDVKQDTATNQKSLIPEKIKKIIKV